MMRGSDRPMRDGMPAPDEPQDAARVSAHAQVVSFAVAGTLLVASFITVLLWSAAGAWRVVPWLLGLSLVLVARLAVAAAFRRRPAARHSGEWLRRLRAAYIAQALVFGAAGAWLYPVGDVPTQAFLAFAIGGLAASSVTVTAFDLLAALLFLPLSLLPLVTRLLLDGGAVQSTMAVSMVLFIAFMAANAARAHRLWLDSVDARRVASDRAEELRALNEQLERVVETRTGDLRASEERLAHALAATNDGVWDWDIRSGHVYYSPVWLRLLGYTAAEIPATVDGFWSLVHPDDADRTRAILEDHLAGRRPDKEIELRLRTRPGDYRWFLDRGRVVARDAEGGALRVVGTIADVTDRRAAVQALHESELRFRAVFDQSPLVVALVSADEHRIVEANAAAFETFGFPRGEGLGKTSLELNLWVDAAERARVIEALERDGAVSDREVHMQRRNGTRFWALLNSSLVTIDGRPHRLTTLLDITARKQAVEALRESEARFRAVFDQGPVVVALVDLAEGRIAEMNALGLRTFGYARDEMIGRTTFELRLFADEDARREAAQRLLRDRSVSSFEIRLRRRNGEEFLALLDSSCVTIGGAPYSLNTLQDITERRRLEHQVSQAQKMEVLGHLAGGMAHDFNNVLTVIRGTAELALLSPGTAPAVTEALETIRDASARATGLTGQLLAFSRRQMLQPAVIDLNDVVRDVAPMLRRTVGEQVVFTATVAPEPATVLADRGSVEQVILNLVINARDAMPNGGPLQLTVGVAAPSGDRSARVTLAVVDSGTGMSDTVRSRLFEPFFTTKDVGKGTGLGLSTVHGIVSQSGGAITVESAPGRGSCFTVSFPLVERTPEPSLPRGGRLVRGDETILLVDDDPDIRDVTTRSLSAAGYHVHTASGGDDALAQLAVLDGAVDLLLTDVVMPGLCGRDLASRVRRTYPGIRILFSSGFIDEGIEEQDGLADLPLIAKPYSLKALTQKVRDVLDA